jgi:cytochrome c-type biogenesis protein CcmH
MMIVSIFFIFFILFSVFAENSINEKNKIAHELYEELRCLVCQNQSLLESNAPLALDLKKIVLDKINQGDSKEDIKLFLVDRYGEFILLKPTYSLQNILLWFGPILFLFIGIFITFRFFKRQSKNTEEEIILSKAEENKLKKIIDNNIS